MTPELRALFPITEKFIYLNHAAVAPLSKRVVSAMHEQAEEVARYGTRHWPKWMAGVEGTRRSLARLIGARSQEIALMPNTSTALASVANGYPWRSGDNVVTAGSEFPANIYPWMRLREAGVTLRMAPERDGRVDVSELLGLVDGQTRIVTVSFVQYASGQRMDLESMAEALRGRDLLFVVDGIQGLGALPLDVRAWGIDAMAADGHKFLMGPEGAGFLYLSPRAFDRIKPTTVGWMSVKGWADFVVHPIEWRTDMTRFEPGTLNAIGYYGLGAAVDTLLEVGIDRIQRYLLDLTDHLVEGLRSKGFRVVSPRNPREKSPIVACVHDRFAADDLFRLLDGRNVIAASRAGRLRFAPHFYNTRDEIDTALSYLPA
ncbi:MAG: aminotransferase class V-fold PLP-dependent enzyme [Acidobacteria bacterium]|nr:aminotransferase class V-fold PLP-dependent enzyme [Acidobacteriota bacterium]